MQKTNKKQLRIAYRLLAIITICISLTACSLLPKEEQVVAPPLVEPASVDYDVAEVTKGEIVKRLTGTANFLPVNSENVSIQQTGARLDKIHVEESDIVEKGDKLVEMDSGNLAAQIQQLEIEYQKADLRIQQLTNQAADNYSIKIAELDKQGIALQLSNLREQLAHSIVVAPIDGVVTFVTDREIGETIDPFESIVKVADTSNLQLLYSAINSSELDDIKIGMNVNVTVAGEEVVGEVVQTPKEVPADIAEKDEDLYSRSLLINIDIEEIEAKIGDTAEIEIVIAEKENTLLIPKNGLRTSGARNYVQLLVDNTKREVDIETGIMSTTEVEVLKGLEEGDEVILK